MSGAPKNPAPQLLGDIRQLIECARQQASVALNARKSALYSHVGRRIRTKLLAGERAAYGDQIVATVSRQLVQEYLAALTSKEVLQAKLHEAVALSCARMDHRSEDEA